MNDALGAKRFAGVWGQADLTRRHRSAVVAALACASLLAASLAAQAAATRGGAKSSPAGTAKSAGKAAKPTGKKVATGMSKDDKSTSQKTVVPQIPLAPGPAPETSEADVALVRSAIDALRSGGASRATSVAAT